VRSGRTEEEEMKRILSETGVGECLIFEVKKSEFFFSYSPLIKKINRPYEYIIT
jgi:hypothetical protein